MVGPALLSRVWMVPGALPSTVSACTADSPVWPLPILLAVMSLIPWAASVNLTAVLQLSRKVRKDWDHFRAQLMKQIGTGKNFKTDIFLLCFAKTGFYGWLGLLMFLPGSNSSLYCGPDGQWTLPEAYCEPMCPSLTINKGIVLVSENCSGSALPVGVMCNARCSETHFQTLVTQQG